jgi:CRP-like cAMP-binding protein
LPGDCCVSQSGGPNRATGSFGLHASYVSYETGSRLYGEEDIPAKIFILLQGQVKVSFSASDGSHLILRVAMPGDMVEPYPRMRNT